MSYRKYLPYLITLLLFMVVSALYFMPQYRGMVLRQHDVVQYEGMTQDILEHRAEFDEDPQWTGSMFGGMPAYLINMKNDGTLVKTIAKAFYFMGTPAAWIFIAMTCFFLMLMCCRVNPWIAIAPSLAYGLSTYFFVIIAAGHLTKMVALAFAPLMLGGVFYAYRRNMWLGAAITGLAGAIQIGANHTQITYYFAFIILAFWINELVRSVKEHLLPRFAKVTGLMLLAAALAVGSNASMLYYIRDHAAETIRGGSELAGVAEDAGGVLGGEGASAVAGAGVAGGVSGDEGAAGEAVAESGDGAVEAAVSEAGEAVAEGGRRGLQGLDMEYLTGWSYGIGETFNLLVPNLYGGRSDGGFSDDGEVYRSLVKYRATDIVAGLPAYWGDQPSTSGPVYIGAVAIFIAVLGLFVLRKRGTLWISVVTIVAIMLAWGRHFMPLTELFYNFMPMYDKFRTVSMILVIVEWSVPFLAALVLQKIWTADISRERFMKGLKYTSGIIGGVLLAILILSATMSFASPYDAGMPDDVQAAMRAERASMLRMDAQRSLVFAALTAGTLLLFRLGRIKKGALVAVLCLLVAADMIPVNLRYMGMERFKTEAQAKVQPTAADKMILEDKEPGFRVLNLATGNPFADATTSYFHRSVGGYHGAKLSRYQDLIERQMGGRLNMEVLDMLNTKYVIVNSTQQGEEPVLQVQVNADANGAAWFVNSVQVVDGAQAEMAALDSLDTRRAAVVERRFAEALGQGADLPADSAAVIALDEYRANYLKYSYDAPSEGVAVFSEIYYPKGWTAYVDGEEAPYFRADYVLRAMVLPAGGHTVEFRFRAPNYRAVSSFTLVCSLVLILGAVGAGVGVVVKRKRETANN